MTITDCDSARSCRSSSRPVRAAANTDGRRRGYVLLLTLLILALAATVMAGVSRVSFARAARSVAAERELQLRWAAQSCRGTLLPRAAQILEAAEAARGGPVAAHRARVVLGGHAVDLAFADETAKLNVNLLVHRRGKAQAEAAVTELVREAGGGSVRPRLLAGKPQAVRPRTKPRAGGADDAGAAAAGGAGGANGSAPWLKPLGAEPPPEADEDEDEFEARPLQSFGQVFPGADPVALAGTDGRPAAAAHVSCWGDGSLNFRRAADPVLRQFCLPALTPAEATRLVRLRRQAPGLPVGDLLDQMGLADEARDVLELRLEERSNCHSLWVVVTTPERSWYHFAVDDRSGDLDATLLFAW